MAGFLGNAVAAALGGFALGQLAPNLLKSSAQAKAAEVTREDPENPDTDPALHWDPHRERRGLGEVVYKANHIAMIVADIGTSAHFYSDIMGFQPIKRPNFDRHGAWFTMGNIELHLIKGQPIVPSGDDLIVGHISIETFDIDKVPAILDRLGVTYRQNVSVPKGGADKGGGQLTGNSSDSKKIVKQYFIRDPDGYYIEICNCDVLTAFCLNKDGAGEKLLLYEEGVKASVKINALFDSSFKMRGLAASARSRQKKQDETTLSLEEYEKLAIKAHMRPVKYIAQHIGCTRNDKAADPVVLENLKARQMIYGDMMQNFTMEQIEEALHESGNNVPSCVRILEIMSDGMQVFHPPAFYEDIDGDGVLDHVATKKFSMQRINSVKK